MTCQTDTFNAFNVLLLDDELTEAVGTAYEAKDTAEVGRLICAHVDTYLSRLVETNRAELQAVLFPTPKEMDALLADAFKGIATPEFFRKTGAL